MSLIFVTIGRGTLVAARVLAGFLSTGSAFVTRDFGSRESWPLGGYHAPLGNQVRGRATSPEGWTHPAGELARGVRCRQGRTVRYSPGSGNAATEHDGGR